MTSVMLHCLSLHPEPTGDSDTVGIGFSHGGEMIPLEKEADRAYEKPGSLCRRDNIEATLTML